MKKYLKVNLVLLATMLLCIAAKANITLPNLISDNMVMQQNVPVHIWGKASIGEQVKVSVGKQNITVTTDAKGNWETWLNPMKASNSATMTVNNITIKNILIGEVWVCSGQSNMEWNVSQSNNGQQEVKDANYNMIHLFVAQNGTSDTTKNDVPGKWVVCASETIPKFTAVGYFFGRGLYQKLKVPVGLIQACWGATNCQAWTPNATIDADPRLAYLNDDWAKIYNGYTTRMKTYEATLAKWKQDNPNGNAAQQPRPPSIVAKDRPGSIYNFVIAPLTHYTIKGAIWYQGEANAYERVSYPYRFLFPAMIQAWRDQWKQGDFPFMFVQLSTLFKHPYWPMLRESQDQTLKLANTAMVVSIDVGDSTDAHYHNKQSIGYRMELQARHMVYGENIESMGPVFKQATIEGNKVRAWFDHAKGLKSTDGAPLTGFVIAGADGKYLPATANIEGETVVLSNPAVANPVNVRYAFKDAPVVNFVNSANLPASPFRTDIKPSL